MMNTHGRAANSWMHRIAPLAIAALALGGCSGETPTDPGSFTPGSTASLMLVDDTHGAIGGVVFDDVNQNGVRDAEDAGLPGLTVSLAYPTGATASAVTDADGDYFFDDLSPAFYIVTAPAVAGRTLTTPANVTIRVTAGQISTVDHGLHAEQTGPDTGSISGTVFDDVNQNGMQDPGEPGLADLEVGLADSGSSSWTATTDADGHYAFDDLVVGSYTVTGPTVEGRIATTPTSANADVTANATVTVDFGLYLEPVVPDTGSISGVVFDDMNQNGMQDAGEPGIAGLAVGAMDTGGTSWTATTDADGHYGFDDLVVGSYTVTGPAVPGWTPTTATSVTADVTSAATTTVDFGLYMEDSGDDEFASIAGVVFEDLDEDGMRDPDEPGIAGVMVRLSSRNLPRNLDTRPGFGIHQYAMTDEDGAYRFEDLHAGTWAVFATPRHRGHLTSDRSLEFTVMAGDDVADADFGVELR